jgi:hypothetical protein
VEHLMNLVSILCCTVIVAVVRNFKICVSGTGTLIAISWFDRVVIWYLPMQTS